MSRILFVCIILGSSLFYVFKFDDFVEEYFTAINNVKQFYVSQTKKASEFIDFHFAQTKTIKELKEENEKLKEYKILYFDANYSLNILNKALRLKDNIPARLTLTNVLSYVNFDDFTKVWVDYEKEDNQILGLISQNYAAGIVKKVANKSLALLNGNEKSNYSVFIGKNKAPGIVHGTYKDNLISIKYIPIWIKIHLKDEVITSGMDNIFFQGLKVGKVVKIIRMPDMQEAIIEPYANTLKNTLYYVYKKENNKKSPQPEAINTLP